MTGKRLVIGLVESAGCFYFCGGAALQSLSFPSHCLDGTRIYVIDMALISDQYAKSDRKNKRWKERKEITWVNFTTEVRKKMPMKDVISESSVGQSTIQYVM